MVSPDIIDPLTAREIIKREREQNMNIGKIEQLMDSTLHDNRLAIEEILKRAVPKAKKILLDHGIDPKTVVSDFDRKAAFNKLAFWLREYGYDDDMAQFIENIALKRDFARDYRVQKHLINMMVKLFNATERFLKPHHRAESPSEYVNRFKALKKETTSIRTFINRLLHTIYRGTQRKPNGGTRSEARGSPDCCKTQTQA